MNIPTGDYLIQFLDFKHEVIPGSTMQEASFMKAEARAEASKAMIGSDRYRILHCVKNSSDKERWER